MPGTSLAIEAQPPYFAPQDGYFYHAMTYGWLVGEVIRRVTGQTPGAFVRDRMADPLGLDLWIGVPEARRGTVARMEAPLPDAVEPQEADASATGGSLVEQSLTMGAYPFPADGSYVTFNDPAIQSAEIPGANGIATARSLAPLYAACVSGVDGGEPWLTEASLDDAMVLRSAGRQLSGLPDDGARWGTGFQLASPPFTPMLGAGSLGHAGAGGQLGFGDRERKVGFGWLSNQMGGYGDARARTVTEALDRVLRG
ncbi:MAG: serine hydrolase domain-containing protein [Candidatus Limnocylindrales bacterium]